LTAYFKPLPTFRSEDRYPPTLLFHQPHSLSLFLLCDFILVVRERFG